MPRFNLSDRMNAASRLTSINTDEYKEMYLEVEKVQPSPFNFYPVDDTGIEELADNMLAVGQLEPVLVGRVDGVDEIVSGHRRREAVRMNFERGYKQFRKVRCLVKEMGRTEFMVALTSANAFNRKLDAAALIEQAAVMKEWFTKAAESGELKIKGKMRDFIAQTLDVSPTKVAQMDKIHTSLVEEGKQALRNGDINFSKAYETSRLEPEEQREVLKNDSLLSSDVKRMVQEKKAGIAVTFVDGDAGEEENVTSEEKVVFSVDGAGQSGGGGLSDAGDESPDQYEMRILLNLIDRYEEYLQKATKDYEETVKTQGEGAADRKHVVINSLILRALLCLKKDLSGMN